ncbi:MAG: FecR family protein, partial [Steroidobacteraceae bacterium]
MDKDTVQPRVNAQILEEAAEAIVELNAADPDHAFRKKFDAWLRTSPEHVRAYLELLPIWEEGTALPLYSDASVEDLIARAKRADNIVLLGTTPSASALSQSPVAFGAGDVRRRRFTIAASIVLTGIALCSLAWFQLTRNRTYVTDIGEQRSISLRDGSLIELNARSRLHIRFTAQQRSVDLLEGQALFRVAKDLTRPFVVTSDGTLVRAVGTQFDVYRQKSGTTTVT